MMIEEQPIESILANMDPKRVRLGTNVVLAATEIGIEIVQDVAAETLKHKPGISLKEFTKILGIYLEQQKAQAKATNNG